MLCCIPEGSFCSITLGAVASRSRPAVVVWCGRAAGLVGLRNNLTSRPRCVAGTGRRGGSALLLLRKLVILLERHADDERIREDDKKTKRSGCVGCCLKTVAECVYVTGR